MPLESLAVGTATEVAKTTVTAIKDFWQRLDAASEKPKPSEYLSQKAIQSIQGVGAAVQKESSS